MARLRGRMLFLALAFLGSSAVALAFVAGRPTDFVASLQGRQVSPPVGTRAEGQAWFRLTNLDDTLVYRLDVRNLANVVAAHIHLAPPGVNGPIAATLAGPFAPGGGDVSGILAEGTIESGVQNDYHLLLQALRVGNAYVDVHTDDGVEPVSSGPGDFQNGEIRGQILRARSRSRRPVFDPERRETP